MTAAPSVDPAHAAAIKAVMDVGRAVANRKIDANDLERAATAECRRLFGRVAGPDDPLWELHVDVARQVLAAGGVPVGELREWVAVWAVDEPVVPERSWIEAALAEDDGDGEG